MLRRIPINPEVLALNNESPIERQILDYLRENPAAQDTLRGIVEWWLLRQKITQSTTDVEKALANLVAEGRLSVRTGPDGQIHFFHSRKNLEPGL
jgi:hypothetical protein